jgi:hypothetical protein
MSQIPENENLFLLLSQEPRPFEVVPFPKKVKGKAFNVSMVILTAMESAQCKAEAEKKAQKFLQEATGKNKGYEDLYNDFCAINILWHATRFENDVKKQFFPTKESILDVLTVDEIGILMNHYYSVLLHKGPIIAEFSEEDLKNWMERIVKDGNSSSFLFNSLSVEALKQLVNGLADQLKTIQMEKSSSGGAPETTS